jgi:hypothetical protein
MSSLQQMFPSLTTFSDLDWEAVTREYEATSIGISFPEYLQIKAEQGDCPAYLFELAFFELAAFDAKTSAEPFPFMPGVYLNPTALFLNLEYDITRMLEEAEQGKIAVYERPHILCLYRDSKDEVNSLELDKDALEILEKLEDGPITEPQKLSSLKKDNLEHLVQKGLILDLLYLSVV